MKSEPQPSWAVVLRGVLLCCLSTMPVVAQTAAGLFDDRYLQGVWLEVEPADWQVVAEVAD